jgi:hypothetical protein
MTDSCLHAAEAVIMLFGWSEYVQPVRDKSLFWHKLWLEGGRPKTRAVTDSMRRTRATYHYSIRRIKGDEETLINERIADSILNNDRRDF